MTFYGYTYNDMIQTIKVQYDDGDMLYSAKVYLDWHSEQERDFLDDYAIIELQREYFDNDKEIIEEVADPELQTPRSVINELIEFAWEARYDD